jgi:hypothetical protein
MGGDVCVLNGNVLDPRRDQLPDAQKGLAQALLDEMTG